MAWLQVFTCLAALACTAVAQDGKASGIMEMHAIVGLECGKVAVDQALKSWLPRNTGGLEVGPCPAGFTESKGSQEVELPLIGTLQMEIFQKPDVMALALDIGQQLQGKAAQKGSACCHACVLPDEKYVSVDRKSGQCKEACLNPAKQLVLSFAGVLDSSFERRPESCSSLGFVAYNATLSKGIEPAGITWDVYHPQPANTRTMCKAVAGLCGEVTLVEEQWEAEVLELLDLQNGSCVSLGYTESSGTQRISDLNAELKLFRQAGSLDVVDGMRLIFNAVTKDTVSLFKIIGQVCSEVTVDRQFETAVEQVGKFSQGNCEDHGYSLPAGSQALDVPLLATLQIALYRKGGSSNILV
mmetsp:Transcript_22062/g.39561  ORF Transcript_22062/g.39561 Transcript_22062/m.39561 type:complete len:356 (-) Transcript_22062:44-1111(-)